jgi:hypothetical protein
VIAAMSSESGMDYQTRICAPAEAKFPGCAVFLKEIPGGYVSLPGGKQRRQNAY